MSILLLTDLTKLKIVENVQHLSPNTQVALAHILKYIQEPASQAYFYMVK